MIPLFWTFLLAVDRTTVGDRAFQLITGATIERVAGPPLVDRPIVADFDELGRLYVADSSGSNEDVKTQVANPTHRVVRLEDTDGDGTFDKRTVFADKLMFPEGALWHEGALYVAAPPAIWKLEDADGDGIAERRSVWHDGGTLTGCANDLHGPYRGRDGRIYWCKGAFAAQLQPRGPGRAPIMSRAAHILRARPDGSDREIVMTGGMDNPVEVAFTPEGERFFTSTFLVHPGGGLRDGIAHAVYGGVYGKSQDLLDGHPRTRPDLMPITIHLGPAAPSGLCTSEFDGALFASQFNLRKVSRHRLEPHGAGFVATTEDVVVGEHQDFHPTDVLEDADGSVLVVDTGGWYKLCCPSSQLDKSDVLGAIYRVRLPDRPRPVDPRGLRMAWGDIPTAELIARLDDGRPAVRDRAMLALARSNRADGLAEAVIDPGSSELRRRNAIWASARIDGPDARAVARRGLADRSPSVRQVSAHVAGLWRDREAIPGLIALLNESATAARRASAEALGRLGDPGAVATLVSALRATDDPILTHSLTYALMEIGDAGAIRSASEGKVPAGATIARDQMSLLGYKADVGFDEVATLLDSDVPATREAGVWLAGRHPEWGPALFGRLDDPNHSASARAVLASVAGTPGVAARLAERIARGDRPALEVARLAAPRLKAVPDSWSRGLGSALATEARDEAVALAGQLPWGKGRPAEVISALDAIGAKTDVTRTLRLDALASVPGGPGTLTDATFAFVADALRETSTRPRAANVLERSTLSAEQRRVLLPILTTAGPIEIDRWVMALARGADPAFGADLVAAVAKAPARASLRGDAVRSYLQPLGAATVGAAGPLLAELEPDAGRIRARVELLTKTLSSGDVRRGQAVFNGPKAGCSTCHAIGYLGGKLGPDLTRIGSVRTERDLLESIVAPSASFVRGYEPVVAVMEDGSVHSGVAKVDSPEELLLVTAADREVRLPRAEIAETRPGNVSIMPAGLDQNLTPAEIADLVTFLRSSR